MPQIKGTAAIRATADALDKAHRTLREGTRFLAAGLCGSTPAADRAIVGPMRAKVIGNGLRELDRFLSVLLDEAARASGIAPDERDRLARIRITADKLGEFYCLSSLARPCPVRLIAFGRMRDCLFWRNGAIGPSLSGDRRGAGWLETIGRTRENTGRIEVAAAELDAICGYYETLALRVVGVARTRRQRSTIAKRAILRHMTTC